MRLLVKFSIIFVAVLDLVLYATVIRPLRLFAARADDVSKGRLDVPELPVRGKGELAILGAAFNRMHRSVAAAMQALQGEPEPEPRPESEG